MPQIREMRYTDRDGAPHRSKKAVKMRSPHWIQDKTRRGILNRLLVTSLVLSPPAFFWTARHLRTLSPFQSVTLPFEVSAARFAPDNSAIVVTSESGSLGAERRIAVYDFPSLTQRWVNHVSESDRARFSPDGSRVLVDSYVEATELGRIDWRAPRKR